MSTPKILAFAGSARKESFNKKMVNIAAQAAIDAGADVNLIDLADYPLPLFNQDLESESGLPENCLKLKMMFIESDGLMIACPEYNSSITPLLKNTIDWVSRPHGDEPRLAAFKGKMAILMAASPGGLGGLRGLGHVRSILSSIGVIVLSDQFALSKAHEAFDDAGNISDEGTRISVENLGKQLAEFTARMKS